MKRDRPPRVIPVDRREPALKRDQMEAVNDTFWHTTYRRHGSAVMAFLTSRLGRRDLAEDLLQETFVRAMRAQGALRDVGKVRSYLFSTAHRLVLNHVRRRRPLLFSELSSRDTAPVAEVPDGGASPAEEAELRRLEERLKGVARQMSPKLRIAFEEAVLRQRPYAEIASEHGWSETQVRVNVCRARKRAVAELRDLLMVEGDPS